MIGHCVAVFGTGNAGMYHLRSLRAAGARILAVPAHSNRRRTLEKAGFATVTDLDEAARHGAQACVVATDTHRHAKDATIAINCGLHVLVEKPAACDASAAYKLLATASRHNRQLYVGCVLRFSESLNLFRHLLRRIGDVHAVTIECRSYLPAWRSKRPYLKTYSARAAEGGVLRDLIHEIDYAGWIFGWPDRAAGRLENFGRLGIRSEELADLHWRSPQGSAVSIGLDYLTRPSRRRMTAYGHRGTLEWDTLAGTVSLSQTGRQTLRRHSSQTMGSMFETQARAFLKALEGRHDEHLTTSAQGAHALAVCDAIRRSSRSHHEERVAIR